MMKKMFLFSVSLLIVIAVTAVSCKGKKNSSDDSSSNQGGNYLSELTKNKGGDFRGYVINQTTIDDVKKNESPDALAQQTADRLFYQYQIDDYNRYDVAYNFVDGKLSSMAIDYYSWENDGEKAYQNGKKIYDNLFDEFNKKGEAQKFSERNYYWKTKSQSGADIKITLADTGQPGSSGTVQIALFAL